MPRQARIVFPNIPHYITQRGNRREDVFFTDNDRKQYLNWLKEYSKEHIVEILAYCLMTNHIHIIAVPTRGDGLERVLKPLHMRHTQRINREKGWMGHLCSREDTFHYFLFPLIYIITLLLPCNKLQEFAS